MNEGNSVQLHKHTHKIYIYLYTLCILGDEVHALFYLTTRTASASACLVALPLVSH